MRKSISLAVAVSLLSACGDAKTNSTETTKDGMIEVGIYE